MPGNTGEWQLIPVDTGNCQGMAVNAWECPLTPGNGSWESQLMAGNTGKWWGMPVNAGEY